MSRTRKVEIVHLSEEVMDVLNSYVDKIADSTDDAADKASRQCVTEIKANAAAAFKSQSKKPYAKQWTRKNTTKGRGVSGWTVYCRTPGLPHLLENGHAKVNGGRVAGVKHIEPAAIHAVETMQKAVEEALKHADG